MPIQGPIVDVGEHNPLWRQEPCIRDDRQFGRCPAGDEIEILQIRPHYTAY